MRKYAFDNARACHFGERGSSDRMSMKASNIVPFETPASSLQPNAVPMKSDLVEKASEIITDPLVLINLVSKRVRQLNQGRSPLINALPSMGFADIALSEIIEGKIVLQETTTKTE